MAHFYMEVASNQRKKVIHDLTENLNKMNISLAYNGLIRYKDNYICSKSRGNGTEINMFYFTINVEKENPHGPPIMTISHLERLVRKLAFVEREMQLPVERYTMFHVKKNRSIDISERKTPKMRLIVEKPDSDQSFVPGKVENPDLSTSSICNCPYNA